MAKTAIQWVGPGWGGGEDAPVRFVAGPVQNDGSDKRSRNETEQGCPDRRKSAGNHRVGDEGGTRASLSVSQVAAECRGG
jgi:hypothetical protein